MIFNYFSKVKDKLEEINWIILKQTISFDPVLDDMGIIEGILIFRDSSILEFMELVGEKDIEYRFHYMDKDKNLIYRWDTSPHHKKVHSFPYHLHTKRGVEDSKKMNFIDILDIVADKVIDNLGL